MASGNAYMERVSPGLILLCWLSTLNLVRHIFLYIFSQACDMDI